jgi:hypothetical protein
MLGPINKPRLDGGSTIATCNRQLFGNGFPQRQVLPGTAVEMTSSSRASNSTLQINSGNALKAAQRTVHTNQLLTVSQQVISGADQYHTARVHMAGPPRLEVAVKAY